MTCPWGFRVATDRRFGAGHLTRSRALAAVLDRDAVFYCDPDGNDRLDLACNSQVVREGAVDSIAAMIAGLRGGTIQASVVDTYAVKDAALNEAAHAGFVAAFRDGLPYGPEAISINPNPGYIANKTVLAGPAYMPLPAHFAQRNEIARRVTKPQSKQLSVLVAFGARDSANRTMTALEGLMAHAGRLNVSVALGADAVQAAAVSTKVAEMECAEILPQREDIAATYGRFDLAIGAPGVSQFERACCGVPSILMSQNEKQAPLARAWSKVGAAVHCEPTRDALSGVVAALLDDLKAVHGMRERGLSLVDGKGAIRLADVLRKKAAG